MNIQSSQVIATKKKSGVKKDKARKKQNESKQSQPLDTDPSEKVQGTPPKTKQKQLGQQMKAKTRQSKKLSHTLSAKGDLRFVSSSVKY